MEFNFKPLYVSVGHIWGVGTEPVKTQKTGFWVLVTNLTSLSKYPRKH